MRIIKLDSIFKNDNRESLAYILDSLNNDGVFIYPTDTIYGIGGNFFSLDVVKRIDEIKGRGDKPYSVAVSDFEMLKTIVKNVPNVFTEKYLKLLPGKYTFLFEISEFINSALVKGSTKIGIRIPNLTEILKLISLFKKPIITTSINETGKQPLNSIDNIIEFIKRKNIEKKINFIIDAGNFTHSYASTIIDITQNTPKNIRN